MRNQNRNRTEIGQSMVEFALTSLLFIGLVVSIIEIARIMHGWLTIQHAARTGARYAVTGQWMKEYAEDPMFGWEADSTDPQQQIAPCWPLFYNDPVTPTPDGPKFYQPFRGPRVCSIEHQVLQQMRPLAINTGVERDQPGYYEVVVTSYAVDSTPDEGSFTRGGYEGIPSATLDYSSFYTAEPEPVGGMVRGYAGRPQEKVVIQIQYNIRLVTPLLANIVPYIPLKTTITMTNEAFGATSALTGASVPPELPEVEPIKLPVPPDLEFAKFNPNLDQIIVPGQSINFNLDIKNTGELNIRDTSFVLTVYAVSTQGGTVNQADARNIALANGGIPVGSKTFTDLQAGYVLEEADVVATFTEKGDYYLFGIVDSGNTIDEMGSGSVKDERREKNNIAELGFVRVGRPVDIEFAIAAADSVKFGHPIEVTVTITNIDHGDTFPVEGDLLVNIHRIDPQSLTRPDADVLAKDDRDSYSAGVWTVSDLALGETRQIKLLIHIVGWRGQNGPQPGPFEINVFNYEIDMPPGQGYYEIEPGTGSNQQFHTVDVYKSNDEE